MRRKEKEITDEREIEAIVRRAGVCRLAMCDDGMPYVVPMNFGYEDGSLYVHCASEGRKLDILRKNNNVCFEVEEGLELEISESGAKCSMKYASVIGTGKVTFIEDIERKKHALAVLSTQVAGNFSVDVIPEHVIKMVTVLQIDVEHMTGKRSV